MFQRRAQGLSINVIIVAVIGLVVLVIIIAIFSGKFGDFSSGVRSIGNPAKLCEGDEGQGGTLRDDNCGEGEDSILSRDSGAQGKKCCKFSSSTTCTDACRARLGKGGKPADDGADFPGVNECTDEDELDGVILSGTFSDVRVGVCCCF